MRGSPSKAANPAALPLSDPIPMVSWHNREARQIKVGGNIHRLSKRLTHMMDAFLNPPGAVVSTDSMIYQLWAARGEEEPDDAYNIVKIQVMKLRKIGVPLETVWGKGYYMGQPKADIEAGKTYIGRDGIGRQHCLKVHYEPVVVMVNDDGEELHVPMSSLRYWELELEDAGRAPGPSGNSPDALPSISGSQAM